jgi:agmatinase
MSWRLYVNKGANSFAGVEVGLDSSRFVVIGVPFDSTSSFRSGARFAPSAIRLAAQNLETYSFRSGIDV